MEYDGTVLLVSHDRAFLNNMVTSVIAFEGRARVQEYVGGYDDWLRQGGRWTEEDAPAEAADAEPAAPEPAPSEPKRSKSKKLSYKLQREFDELPEIGRAHV